MAFAPEGAQCSCCLSNFAAGPSRVHEPCYRWVLAVCDVSIPCLHESSPLSNLRHDDEVGSRLIFANEHLQHKLPPARSSFDSFRPAPIANSLLEVELLQPWLIIEETTTWPMVTIPSDRTGRRESVASLAIWAGAFSEATRR